MGDRGTVSALYPIFYLLYPARQCPGCKVFRAMALEGVLGAIGRFENAMEKRCEKSPIYFGKGG
jgi:hypothetical protein